MKDLYSLMSGFCWGMGAMACLAWLVGDYVVHNSPLGYATAAMVFALYAKQADSGRHP